MFRPLRSPWLALLVCGLVACSSEPLPEASGATQAIARDERARASTLMLTLSTTDTDIEAASDALRRWVEDEGGYVQETWTTEHGVSSTLRLPAERLPAFRRAASELGTITHQHERVEDVTDQRVDLDARLANARTEEARLRVLMRERTATLTEVLAVEARLAEVRGRIEQLDGQRANLAQRIAYAEVELTVTGSATPFWEAPGEALQTAGAWGVNAAQALAVGALAVVVALGPMGILFALGLAVIATLVRFGLRRRRAA